LSERWSAAGFYSMANGRVLGGDYLRRMPPPLGGARLRWSGRGGRRWIEGIVSFAGRQTRLSAGDLGDARIGAPRTRATIAGFFNGTATDLGLVQNGVLVETGETLAEVQARVLGTAAAGTLYTETPGFVVFGLRGGWRFGRQLELTVIGENLTDRNYRLHGSGVDGPGVNVEIRARYRF
jgi:outer membrane receptor protein involved in Fe transport